MVMLMQNRTSQTGDALWVARSKADPKISYALDYVVERKNVKDLVGSIKSGRYERQKYVLQRCGLRRVMYLIEGNPDAEVQGVRPLFLMAPPCHLHTARLCAQYIKSQYLHLLMALLASQPAPHHCGLPAARLAQIML